MEIEVIVTDPRLAAFGLPAAQTVGSAGLDLRAFFDGEELDIPPGGTVFVDSGLRVWIKDPNYAGFMYPRSGTGTKGLVLGNGTGIIDADYQGPLKICLYNRLRDSSIRIKNGDRVAQLVIAPVATGYDLVEVAEFTDTTERGTGGFGSTGVK
jgi:dUTP pyrophosphatase